MSERLGRRLLMGILAAFVVLSGVYSLVVPPFEASDELWHYPMVKHIADNWSLPVQDPANVGPWRQEGSQPPLYYFLGAVATFWIDTSDMAQVRYLNPHVDNGIATPDGNVNLVVHRPGREAFPWRGTVLAVHVVRFLSVLMSACAVYLTYRIARQVLPGEPALALGATAIHAFTPMVVFIAGSVNNDNLVVPLSSLALLMLIKLARGESARGEEASGEFAGVPVGKYLVLGVVLGLAALTKASSLALTVLTALVVTVRAVRGRSWREFFVGGVCTLLPLLAIAGWWYLRNLRLYGDLTGLNAFIEVLGKRDVPAGLAQLWRERFSFLAGYWGNFGGLNVPMSAWVYGVLNALLIVAAIGLVLVLLFSCLPIPLSAPLSVSRFPLVLCLLWGLGVFIPWIQWARVTWSSQGRLIFAALPVWSMLLALGWAGWMPRRWRRWVMGGLALFLLGLSAAAPWVWIRPAYARPEPLTDAQVSAIPRQVEASFGGTMRLLGCDLGTEVTAPGGEVEVTLYWEALAPTDRDYTVFVHLLGEHDLLIAQRDTHPGLGLLSTTWLEPGYRWADRYVIPVPETAYAPDVAQIAVGLYDPGTERRLPAVGEDGNSLGDHVRFGRVAVRPRAGDVPNPIAVNFGGKMMLMGYDLSRRAVRPGEAITLTLHWRALGSMDRNYTVSTQFVDEDQRKAAQSDSWPLEGSAPTAAWEPGDVITETRRLEVYGDAPLGAYGVRVAVYTVEEGEIVHLPVIPEGGAMLRDHVTLDRVRVGE